jgi:predicted nicotinamide N-methyase
MNGVGGACEQVALDWEMPDPTAMARLVADVDLVVASDVVFDPTLCSALVGVVDRLVSSKCR